MKVVIYIAILGAIYAFFYVLNHKTKVPEGCENIKATCKGCTMTSCGNHPSHDESEERGAQA